MISDFGPDLVQENRSRRLGGENSLNCNIDDHFGK